MKRLRELREGKGLNMRQTAEKLNLPYTTYVNYEKGVREPGGETLVALAEFFGTTTDHLLGRTDAPGYGNVESLPGLRRIPLLGTIACGLPLLASENVEQEVGVPENIRADFALRCKGDSMINARIFSGDVVYIRQQDTAENGQIAAVLIGEEATLKRVRQFPDHISLEPENPQYRPIVLWGDEMNSVRILGVAVAFTGTVV